MTVLLEGRLKDLITTADRQLAAGSYDAAIDTYQTALAEVPADAGADVRGEVEGRLAAACRAREISRRAAASLREARYHQTAGRFPEAYRACLESLALDPENGAALQLRDQLMTAVPELATLTIAPPVIPEQPIPVEMPAAPESRMSAPPTTPPAAEPQQYQPDPRPIEPPRFELMENNPYQLERPRREDYVEEPPLSILDPTPRPERNEPYFAIVGAVLVVLIFFVALFLGSARKDQVRTQMYSTSNTLNQPVLISKVDPQYTDEARAAGIEGTVILQIAVDPDGTPEVLSVVHGVDPGLDARAAEVVRWWRFQPANKDGRPVRFITTIGVPFQLK